jgi:hypothetical protein
MTSHETAVLSFDSEVSTFLCVQKRWGSELPVIVGIDSYARCSPPPCIFLLFSHGSLFFSYFYEARIIPVKFLFLKIQRPKGRYQSSSTFSKVGRQEIQQSWIDRPRTFDIIIHYIASFCFFHRNAFSALSS